VKGVGSWVFGSSNRTGGNKDEKIKDEGGIRLANTQVCQRFSEVFRVGELLLLIYSGLCTYSQTIT